MNTNTRRFVRPLVLLLLAASLTACHFHGHGHGGWGRCVPVRHCR